MLIDLVKIVDFELIRVISDLFSLFLIEEILEGDFLESHGSYDLHYVALVSQFLHRRQIGLLPLISTHVEFVDLPASPRR